MTTLCRDQIGRKTKTTKEEFLNFEVHFAKTMSVYVCLLN
jgi:hypothetical protein